MVKKKLLSPIDYLCQSWLNKVPVYCDRFYSGLFSLKSCLLSVLVNLSAIYFV